MVTGMISSLNLRPSGGFGLVSARPPQSDPVLARYLPLARHVLGRIAHVIAVEGIHRPSLIMVSMNLTSPSWGRLADCAREAPCSCSPGHPDDDLGRSELDRWRPAPPRASPIRRAGSSPSRASTGCRRRSTPGAPGSGRHLQRDICPKITSDTSPGSTRARSAPPDRDLAQLVGGQAGERPVEGADGVRAATADHDGGLVLCSSLSPEGFRRNFRARGTAPRPSQGLSP